AILAIAIIMGIFTGLNGFLMSSSRLLFSMGRSGIMPSVFSKLHNKYKTPYVAIIFLVAITLIAPWLGRTALTWIVDMSSTGVSIAYFITCLSAARLFSYDKTSNTYGPVYKTFAIIGTVVSFVFLLLLLIRYSKLTRMDNDKLSKLILNRSEDEVVNLINENKVTNQTHKYKLIIDYL